MSARHTTQGLLLALAASLISAWAMSAPASAAPAPHWQLESSTAPRYLPPGASGLLVVVATNLGDSEISAANVPVTLSEKLPAGLTATQVVANVGGTVEMSCELDTLTCTTVGAIAPYHRVEMLITVNAPASMGVLNATATLSGGDAIRCAKVPEGTGRFTDPNCLSEGAGSFEKQSVGPAPEASLAQSIEVGSQATPFGVERYGLSAEEEDGSRDTRAGSHPFQLTTTLDLNQIVESNGFELDPAAPGLLRNLNLSLPAGMLGDPQAVAQCSDVDFSAIGGDNENACAPASAIGAAVIRLAHPLGASPGRQTLTVPVFNLVPAPGEPARFGFEAAKVPVILDTSVRTGSDYGVSVSVDNASQAAQVLASQVSIWGEPGNPIHDPSRGWACLSQTPPGAPCDPTPSAERSTIPFLTLPTACTGALSSQATGSSWGAEPLADETSLPGLEGCVLLPFTPTLGATPVQGVRGEMGAGVPTSTGATPTGLDVHLHLPQEATLAPEGLAESTLEDSTVTLPVGLELNPSAANGLQACSEAQVGYTGTDPQTQTPQFTPGPASCPQASKLGVVHIATPDLAHELQGAVYLAAQEANPFGSLLALYIAAEDPFSKVRAKLAGKVSVNEQTGQLTATFSNTPQVPFEDLEMELFGGPRASLSTPALCGSYTTRSVLTPWSGGQAAQPLSSFAITSGSGAGPCADPSPFTPSFAAGSTSPQAGAYTPFTLQIGHPDGDQPLTGLTVHLPPGVAAMLASIMPCPEPAPGQEWSCGPESRIGHSTAWSGVGPEPVALPGSVYLTTGYGGAPFGLLVQTPAVAGPFNLGFVDVRSKILVDPNTAAVDIQSDPLPQFVKGIPAQLKQVEVTVDRPGFEFNPTSCNRMAVTGTLSGSEGGSAQVSSPFQVSGCGGLPFHPVLSASVGGHASRPYGDTFVVKLASAGLGQANIAKVDLQLPIQLPSRLPTLQKACLAGVFETNPASCSSESVIGQATIHTPVLKNPLSGPAYLVSHGNAAFPDVEFVLQGENITLVLDGKTDIKKGITYSRFETAPDAPFTIFETVLPAGPHSALTAYVAGNNPLELCGSKLAMPTEITSQSGTTIRESTPITITGCTGVAAYKATRAQLLAKALAACRHKYKHKPHKRAACERAAKKRYAPPKTRKSNKTASHKARR